MARPIKQGLEYFTVDTDWDRKMKLFQAKFKAEGVGIIIILWQWIYNKGYFINWDDETKLMFASDNHIEEMRLDEMIDFAIEKEIFSKRIYNQYRILTSKGIQKRYLNSCLKRTEIRLHKKLLLINPILPDWSKSKLIISKNEGFLVSKTDERESETIKKESKIPIKDSKSTQRRERRGEKVKESRERRVSKGNNPPPSPLALEVSSSKQNQSRDGPLKTDQIGPDGKKLLSPEDIQKEKERQLQALKEMNPEAYLEIMKNNKIAVPP